MKAARSPIRIVLVVGRPGAGKSTLVARAADVLGKVRPDLSVRHFDDYPILAAMAAGGADPRIRPVGTGNFEVREASVLDEALGILFERAKETVPGTDLTFLEFARPDYARAFARYPGEWIRSTQVVHVTAPFSVCASRNDQRASSGGGQMPVPAGLMVARYMLDDLPGAAALFGDRYVEVANDVDDLGWLEERVSTFVRSLAPLLVDLKVMAR